MHVAEGLGEPGLPEASSCRPPVPQSCEVRERSPSLATRLLVCGSVHFQQICF